MKTLRSKEATKEINERKEEEKGRQSKHLRRGAGLPLERTRVRRDSTPWIMNRIMKLMATASSASQGKGGRVGTLIGEGETRAKACEATNTNKDKRTKCKLN